MMRQSIKRRRYPSWQMTHTRVQPVCTSTALQFALKKPVRFNVDQFSLGFLANGYGVGYYGVMG